MLLLSCSQAGFLPNCGSSVGNRIVQRLMNQCLLVHTAPQTNAPFRPTVVPYNTPLKVIYKVQTLLTKSLSTPFWILCINILQSNQFQLVNLTKSNRKSRLSEKNKVKLTVLLQTATINLDY